MDVSVKMPKKLCRWILIIRAQIKTKNVIKFLSSGDKVKITLRFRGREMAHQKIGMDLLKRVEADLEEMAKVEQFPVLEGRQLVMMMAPNKK